MRKELLPSLLRREVVVALDDPALVISLTKFCKRLPQLLHGLKRSHPEQLLFERADEPLDAAISFWLSYERRRRHPQESDLSLKVVAHVLAAVVMPAPQARRDTSPKATAIIAHALPDRLECLEPRRSLGRVVGTHLKRSFLNTGRLGVSQDHRIIATGGFRPIIACTPCGIYAMRREIRESRELAVAMPVDTWVPEG